jgi:hypothetical protein
MKVSNPRAPAKSSEPIVRYEDGLPVRRGRLGGEYIDLSAGGQPKEGVKEDTVQKKTLWQRICSEIEMLHSKYRLWRGIETYVGREGARRWREALREIKTVGIRPSSDARVLYEEFAKRFFFVEARKEEATWRPIRIIAKTGGSFYEMAFVLRILFEANGIDYEIDEYYGDEEGNIGRGKIDHFLLYVPALDQYFDPSLRLAGRLKSGWDPRHSVSSAPSSSSPS